MANFKEVDPDLGALNLSKGGAYPVEYALRLGAGFGSQIAMTLLHWVTTKDGVHQSPNALGYAYRIADTAAWNAWAARSRAIRPRIWKWFDGRCGYAIKRQQRELRYRNLEHCPYRRRNQCQRPHFSHRLQS